MLVAVPPPLRPGVGVDRVEAGAVRVRTHVGRPAPVQGEPRGLRVRRLDPLRVEPRRHRGTGRAPRTRARRTAGHRGRPGHEHIVRPEPADDRDGQVRPHLRGEGRPLLRAREARDLAAGPGGGDDQRLRLVVPPRHTSAVRRGDRVRGDHRADHPAVGVQDLQRRRLGAQGRRGDHAQRARTEGQHQRVEAERAAGRPDGHVPGSGVQDGALAPRHLRRGTEREVRLVDRRRPEPVEVHHHGADPGRVRRRRTPTTGSAGAQDEQAAQR